ncbi:MAG: RsmD family RNA methyltransferase [Muribaculaceae bacterium]|nr:RsmD family RNA methyltransferase [Muribaculaceae bacterium]
MDLKFNKDYYRFLEENADADINALRLTSSKKCFDFDFETAITQIECRRKNKIKLKDFVSNTDFFFPDPVSSEQSSHQGVARFHASLIQDSQTVLDMTSGLGIDALTIADYAKDVTAIDLDIKRVNALIHNSLTLGKTNIKVIQGDSIEILQNSDCIFDVIFIDPSRRDQNNKRLYNLSDCSPDVLNYQNLLFSKSKRVLIKASPLLDISQTIKDFEKIEKIFVIGVKGECKEILIVLNSEAGYVENKTVSLEAVDLNNDGNIISSFQSFYPSPDIENKNIRKITYALISDLQPDSFILEPSAMIMKIAPWQEICERFDAKKLGVSSHLFVTNQYPENFPGRVTRFKKIIQKQDKKHLSGSRFSVISRNHPLSSEEIRKSFKLKEGDKNFIYATRLGDKPLMFITESL